MLFDIRGRRKNVVRVVYAVLALLMGASLFLFAGGGSLGDLFNTGGSAGNASAALEEQADRIEGRLRRNPDDEALLLSLTRTRIAAGNAQAEVVPETGEAVATPEGRIQLEQAVQAWNRYLKQTNAPNSSGAQLVASAHFSLAQTSPNLEEAFGNVAKAADAQRIVAEARPSVGSLSTLAIYEYFAGDFAAGDKATSEAKALTTSKEEKKSVVTQLATYRENGKRFEKQKQEASKAEQGASKEALQNPFGGLAGAGVSP